MLISLIVESLGTKQGSNPCSGTMLLNKQVFGENLKGAGSVRQDLPMYNLDLGNIAENKTCQYVLT